MRCRSVPVPAPVRLIRSNRGLGTALDLPARSVASHGATAPPGFSTRNSSSTPTVSAVVAALAILRCRKTAFQPLLRYAPLSALEPSPAGEAQATAGVHSRPWPHTLSQPNRGKAVMAKAREKLMSRYNTLRVWAQFLIVLGVGSLVIAGFGVIAWAVEVEGFWQTIGVISLGAPFALFLASWPMALGQMMRAIAGIGDAVDVMDTGKSGAGFP